MTLTAHILTHNNEATISKAIQSLKPLNADIVIIDKGSTDGTCEIARSHKIDILPTSFSRDEARNQFIQKIPGWHFYLEPWEEIVSGHSSLLGAMSKGRAGRVLLSSDDLITKPLRLWEQKPGLRFVGPVFESLSPEPSATTLNTILTATPKDESEEQLREVLAWQKAEPTDAEPCYYEAMIHLSKFRHDDFLRAANHFLFRSPTNTMSVILTRYYIASTNVMVKKDARQAFANLVVCLSVKPLMAEFWCLLGDIHYFLQRDFEKAYRFYKAAMILGSKRKTGDHWPVQLSKYKDYPLKIMDSCRMIGQTRRIFAA